MANASLYHVAHRGRKHGPFTLVELSSRRLSHDMLVWQEGMPQWVPISDVPELRPYLHHAATDRTVIPPASRDVSVEPRSRSMSVDNAISQSSPIEASPATRIPVIPAPPKQLRRLKMLSIAMIVLSSLGVLCCPFSVAGAFNQQFPSEFAMLLDVQTINFAHAMLYALLFLVSIPMLVGGVGLLYRRRWAAITAIASSVVCLACYAAIMAFDCGFIDIPLVNRLDDINFDSDATVFTALALISQAISGGLSIGWHSLCILVLNSRTVRASLR